MSSIVQQFDGLTGKELVLWTRPQATGVVVGSIAIVLLLLGYMEYTFLTLICRLMQVTAGLWFIAAQLGRAPTLTRTDISQNVQRAINAAEPHVVHLLGNIIDVISWQDPRFTGKVLFATFLLAFTGTLFSDLTLIFLTTIGAFAGPITYIQNQPLIDAQIAKAKPIINDLLA